MPELAAQQKLIAALCDPRHNLLHARRVRLIETHISWVLLAGRYAYKIKKAVNLEFLDFTRLESRRFFCEEELRVNRRIAPQLYLEVVSICGNPERPVLGADGSSGHAIEYAVKMRRFPADNLLDRLLEKGRVTPRHIDRLAATLAAFHANLPPAPLDSTYGSPAGILGAAVQNFEQMRPLLKDAHDLDRLFAIRRLTEAEFTAREREFAARRAQGWVRECHGDLHLGNIALIAGAPVPFDGIEFSANLRWQDVMSEAAFPVMDLLRHGQEAFGFRLLNAYLEAGGDYAGISTLRFYLAYRAMVRAKIHAIRASQPGLPQRTISHEFLACRSYLAVAEQCLTRRHAALIITHGLPGSGKTTFAQLALERLGAIRIRSDVERKRLFGLHALEDTRAITDIYGKEATHRTYARLELVARTILAAGFPAIVDAAFLRRGERERFRAIAQEMNAPFAIAAIRAPDEVLRARVTQRRTGAWDASEADENVLSLLERVQEPVTEGERAWCVEFNNSEASGTLDAPQNWECLYDLIASRRG